jgi:ABC-type uncharacterized transport system involved in gliding motility auxiliary subunit
MAESKTYRSKFYLTNGVLLALVVGALVLLNLTSNQASRLKVDLSEDQLYSISPATVKILEKLEDRIVATYYVSENLDTFIGTLRRDTVDLFEEFRRLSGGKFEYRVIDPDKDIETRASEKTAAYMTKYEKGETAGLEEPKRPFNPYSLFGQQQEPTDAEIRAEREDAAAQVADKQKRVKSEVYREILLADYKEAIELELAQQGIHAQVGQDRKGDSVRQLKFYSAIKIEYLNQPPEVISSYTSLEGIEYELANRFVKLTTEVKPTIAFFDSRKPAMPEQNPFQPNPELPQSEYAAVIEYLRALFDVREISMKEGDAVDDLARRLREDAERRAREARGDPEPKAGEKPEVTLEPADYARVRCLIVAQPDQLEDRQVWEISRAVSMGVKTVFLVSPYSLDIAARRRDPLDIPIASLDSKLEALLRSWGVQLGDEILASNTCGVTIISYRHQQLGIPVSQPIELPVIVVARTDGIEQESSFTNRIANLVFPATAGLRFDEEAAKKAGLTSKVLVTTAPETWKVKVSPFDRLQNQFTSQQGPGMSVRQYQETLANRKDPDQAKSDFIEPAILALELGGKFPFQFQGQAIPEWKKPEAKPADGESGGGELPFGHPPITDRDALVNLQDPTASGGDSAEQSPPAGASDTTSADPVSAEGTAVPDPAAAPPAPATSGTDGAVPPVVDTGSGASAPAPTKTASIDSVDGRVLILGSVDMLKDSFLQFNREFPPYRQNVDLLSNAAELLALDDLLLQIRKKSQTVRTFKANSADAADWIQWGNLLGVPLIVAVVGLARFVLRRAGSVAYERNYLRTHESGK